MAAPGRFNLQWDGFEANRRVALEESRTQSEFSDVTLVASDGRRVQANKVILANGSLFFYKILSENPHPDPMIYLTGVKYKHLLSLLDFLYTGEVSIVQKSLNQFLNIAGHLEIKSLPAPHQGQLFAEQLASSPRESLPHSTTPSRRSKTFPQSTSEDGTYKVKVEVDDTERYNVPYGMNDQREPLISCLTNRILVSDAKVTNKAISAGMKPKEEVVDFNQDMFHIKSVGSALGRKELIHGKRGEENISMIPARKRDNHIELDRKKKNKSMRSCGDEEEVIDSNCEIVFTKAADGVIISKPPSHAWYEQGEENKDENMIEDEEHDLYKVSSCGGDFFQCSYCTKMFPSSSKLKIHRRRHTTGEMPFQCSVCFKTFSQLGHLDQHKRIHSGEKPYKCSICSKRFYQLSHLNQHLRKNNKCYPKL